MTDPGGIRAKYVTAVAAFRDTPVHRRRPLTRTQRLILDFIESFIGEHRYAPTFEEIAKHFGYRSLATVHEHLENLRHRGWIRVEPHQARGITIREEPTAVTHCARCGYRIEP